MAQNSYGPRVDSLLNLADNAGRQDADSLYMEVGHLLAYQKAVDAIPFLEKSLQLAELKHHYKIMCMAYSFLGIASSRIGSYDKAVQYYRGQIDVAKQHGIVDEVAWANNNIGLVLLELKNYAIANIYLQEAKEIADSLQDDNIRQYVYSKIGRYMQETGDCDSSVYYFMRVLDIRLKPPVDSINLSSTYRDLGNVYYSDMQYDKAKYNYGISMSLVDTTISNMAAPINVNLAIIYMSENNLDSALHCANVALRLAQKFNDRMVMNYAYGVMGNVYYTMGDFQKAEHCLALQIQYQDSVKSNNVVKKIYDLQYQKQIHDQQQSLSISKSYTRINLYVGLTLLIFMVGGIVFALWFRKKEQIIKAVNLQIEHQNNQTNEGIAYAQKIQQAVLPNIDFYGQDSGDKFIVFRPKQMVSGNFYWMHSVQGYQMMALCDAGESGVPGGFLSMLGSSILHEIAAKDTDPSRILELLRSKVLQVIRKVKPSSQTTQGLDISLFVLDSESHEAHFSGVKFPLLLIRDGELMPIQDNDESNTFYEMDFVTTTLDLKDGDRLYMMTHGYTSQRNEAGEELSVARLYQKLIEIHQQPMRVQHDMLIEYLDQWRGSRPQERDLLLTGGIFKLNSQDQ